MSPVQQANKNAQRIMRPSSVIFIKESYTLYMVNNTVLKKNGIIIEFIKFLIEIE